MASSSLCNKSFCTDYMLLKPEEAGFIELVKILFSKDVSKSKFIDCPDDRLVRESFGRRWIIFVSIMVQKLLQATSKPMSGFGSAIEYWLNLLSGNGGFFKLVMNSIGGKVIYPDKTSSKFASLIGNIDKRIKLESSINSPQDRRYYPALCVMAAKASYENQKYIQTVVNDHWEMNFLGFYDFWNDYQEKTTTQAFIFEDRNDHTIISFRGTEAFDADAWSSDFDISWYEIPKAGKVHGGFMKALGLQKRQGWPKELLDNDQKPKTAYYHLRDLLKEKLKANDKAKFIVTGHSLGGALAVLFPAVLALHEEAFLLERLDGVYTFGQPRVGDERFGEFMKKAFDKYDVKYYRFVYSFDLVPRLPYDDKTLMFKHFGTCIYYNSFYKGKVVSEEPDKNYFSLLWLIPKMVNACWELVRSFTMTYTRGPTYTEGGLLRMFRMIGIFVAGVPAHCPQDYVNATRLGSSDVFSPDLNDQKVLKKQ